MRPDHARDAASILFDTPTSPKAAALPIAEFGSVPLSGTLAAGRFLERDLSGGVCFWAKWPFR